MIRLQNLNYYLIYIFSILRKLFFLVIRYVFLNTCKNDKNLPRIPCNPEDSNNILFL